MGRPDWGADCHAAGGGPPGLGCRLSRASCVMSDKIGATTVPFFFLVGLNFLLRYDSRHPRSQRGRAISNPQCRRRLAVALPVPWASTATVSIIPRAGICFKVQVCLNGAREACSLRSPSRCSSGVRRHLSRSPRPRGQRRSLPLFGHHQPFCVQMRLRFVAGTVPVQRPRFPGEEAEAEGDAHSGSRSVST